MKGLFRNKLVFALIMLAFAAACATTGGQMGTQAPEQEISAAAPGSAAPEAAAVKEVQPPVNPKAPEEARPSEPVSAPPEAAKEAQQPEVQKAAPAPASPVAQR